MFTCRAFSIAKLIQQLLLIVNNHPFASKFSWWPINMASSHKENYTYRPTANIHLYCLCLFKFFAKDRKSSLAKRGTQWAWYAKFSNTARPPRLAIHHLNGLKWTFLQAACPWCQPTLSSLFLACNSRLRIYRHHPLQRAVLSQICCFGEHEVVLF